MQSRGSANPGGAGDTGTMPNVPTRQPGGEASGPHPPDLKMRKGQTAWTARAEELARWAWGLLVNRRDCWGRYGRGPRTAKGGLTRDVLRLPFRRGLRNDRVGLHSTAPDDTCRWAAIDIDAHPGDLVNPAANLTAALTWYSRLAALGLRPLLTDSNGGGGY